ncbi:MAG: T9SS type A sorting domain-containing protein [Gilvibacter sp.]
MKTTLNYLKVRLVLLLVLLSIPSLAQDITLSFQNAEVTSEGLDSFYEADIFIVSTSDFKLGSGQVYFTYNNDAFQDNLVDNSRVEVLFPAGSILGQTFGFPAYKDFILNDNTDQRLSFSFQQGLSSGTITENNVTSTPTLLFRVKMQLFTDVDGNFLDPDVCFEDGDIFLDQFFTACGPATPGFPDCTNFPGVQILNDSFDCSDAAPSTCQITTTWDGSSWDNGLPDATKNVVITNNYLVGTSDSSGWSACSLTINTDGAIIITIDQTITVVNDIEVQSAAGGSNPGVLFVDVGGSLVQINDEAQVINSGEIYVSKKIEGLDNRGFVIAGSPMTIQNRESSVFEDALQVRQHITANFTPNAEVAAFDPLATNFADDDGDNWQHYSGLLNPGQGFLVMPQETPVVPDDQDYVYTFYDAPSYNGGTLNNGVINFDVIFGDDQNDSPNILANPYPSAIDANKFISANNTMIGTIYFWEHLNGPSDSYPGYNPANYDMGDISMYTPGSGGVAAANGGEVPDQYISSGEGFGIKAMTNGTAVFNNDMRVTGNNSAFKAPTGLIKKDRIWLTVSNADYGHGSQTLVAFTEGAGPGFEPFYDAQRLATPVSLYSVLEDGSELAIQGTEAFNIEVEISLGFRTQVLFSSEYTISLDNLDAFTIDEDLAVILEDKFAGKEVNLKDTDYTFESEDGTFNDRFVLKFKTSVLGQNQYNDSAISIAPNPTYGIFRINSVTATVNKVEIVDLHGRLVKSFRGQESYDVSGIESAVYFVRIHTDYGMLLHRLIKR